MASGSTPFNRPLHRFAIFIACATFILIIAGALVTSNDAGLSIPDWAQFVRSALALPHLVGGTRYEWSHRAIAGNHRFIDDLHCGGDVVRRPAQVDEVARRGGFRNRSYAGGAGRPDCAADAASVGVVGACRGGANLFLHCGKHRIVYIGRNWVAGPSAQLAADPHHPSLTTLTLLSVFMLYLQLILGAMFRHHGMSWWPHVVNAPIVAVILTWTAVRALTQYPNLSPVRRNAVLILSLLIAQLCLRFLAFVTRVDWGRDAVQPELPMVASTVAHVATGALLLATTVVLTIQVWWQSPKAVRQPAVSGKPVTV